MDLMTKELEKQFPPLYSTEQLSPEKVKIIAKYFHPCSNWTCTKSLGSQARICIQTACILTLYSLQNLNKLLNLNQNALISKIEKKFSDLIELVKKGHQSDD